MSQVFVQHVVHRLKTTLSLLVFREMPNNDTFQPRQDAPDLYLVEHAVYLAHSLTRILEEKNQPLVSMIQEIIVRASQSAEHAHIASHQDTRSLTRLVQRMVRHRIHGHLPLKDFPHGHDNRVIITTCRYSLAHRTVDTHHPRRYHTAVKCRGIAEADEPFGMAGKLLQRYSLQHLHGSVTATAAHDGLDGRVPECPKQIGSPFLSRTGKTMIRAEHMFTHHGHIAPTA